MSDVQVLHGDALELLPTLGAASVDAVVTDPPYALRFMGREWDAHESPQSYRAWSEIWARECLRVLKPGGFLLAFGGTRTHHRLACAVEDAGFEIRDTIAWLYGSGFPKSLNLGDGRGTALKPAFEPIVVARKPLAGTVAANVLAHGTGALNIDGCRVAGDEDGSRNRPPSRLGSDSTYAQDEWTRTAVVKRQDTTGLGRWPPNVVLDEAAAAELDRQSGTSVSRVAVGIQRHGRSGGIMGAEGALRDGRPEGHDDSGGASRFFPTFRYEPKAPADQRPRVNGTSHPTVKPLDLMRWLVRLVTPPGGLVLDPFAGSGTTGEACVIEGFHCVLIEREADYLPLIRARLDKPIQPTLGVAP